MPPLPSLSKEFNDMVGKPLDEIAFRNQAMKEGLISRVINEGDRYTKNLRTNRVNAKVGKDKKVESIYIG